MQYNQATQHNIRNPDSVVVRESYGLSNMLKKMKKRKVEGIEDSKHEEDASNVESTFGINHNDSRSIEAIQNIAKRTGRGRGVLPA